MKQKKSQNNQRRVTSSQATKSRAKSITLVTGGSGFVGVHLVRELLALGRRVRVLDVVPPPKDLVGKIEFYNVDIRDFLAVKNACEGVSIIHHTVAVVPISKAGSVFFDINVQGTRNVLEAAHQLGIKNVINISTSSVYASPKDGTPIREDYKIEPIGEYGRSKWEAELVCQKYASMGLCIVTLRPRTIIGQERMGIFSILFDWIMRGKNIYVLGDGKNMYQFLSIHDLVDAAILAEKYNKSAVFNVGAAVYGTFAQNLSAVINHAKTGSRIVTLNATLARTALRILDVIGLSPLSEFHYTTLDKHYVFDISSARKELGWKPKWTNERMLIENYDWYVKEGRFNKNEGTTHRAPLRQKFLKVIRFFS